MITLFQFPPAWGIANISPFCLTVETYLRMAELPYQCKYTMRVKRAPKGKLPFIIDGEQTIPDSHFILAYLKQHYGDPLDQHLSSAQHSMAYAVRALLNEQLYWVGVYYRWGTDSGWQAYRDILFSRLPWYARRLVESQVKRYMNKRLKMQGIGLHQPHEIAQLGQEAIHALASYLSDQPYFFLRAAQ